ncbi:MAG: hypothetical protein Q9226_004360 [Calogaya cf. arnoldii]
MASEKASKTHRSKKEKPHKSKIEKPHRSKIEKPHKPKKEKKKSTLLAPPVDEDDDSARAQLDYEVALKQAEILRLRHMTKKLERELQSTSRTQSGNERNRSHTSAIPDKMDKKSAAVKKPKIKKSSAGKKRRKESPAPISSENPNRVPATEIDEDPTAGTKGKVKKSTTSKKRKERESPAPILSESPNGVLADEMDEDGTKRKVKRTTTSKKRKGRESPDPISSENPNGVPATESHQMSPEQVRNRVLYEAKTFLELRRWISEAESHFNSLTIPIDDAAKIRDAIEWVAPGVKHQWQNHETNRHGAGQFSWKDLVEFLESHFGDPVERKLKTLQEYHDAKPGRQEGIGAFKAYLGRLEEELPPYTEEQRALHLELRLRIAGRRRAPLGPNYPSQNGGPSNGDLGQNGSNQWSPPRGPRGSRGGPRGGSQDSRRGGPRGGHRGGLPSHSMAGRNAAPNRTAHAGPEGENAIQNWEGPSAGPRREPEGEILSQDWEGQNPAPGWGAGGGPLSQDRESQIAGAKRPKSDHQDKASAKRQRHGTVARDIKQEPDDFVASFNQAYQLE